MSERRDTHRIPLRLFLNEYVNERMHRAVATNVSPTGLYLQRVSGMSGLQFGRDDRYVQIEMALPGTSDVIWARGEVRYDDLAIDPIIHGTGIFLTDIARGHARMLKEFVIDHKRQKLQRILELVRYNRYH
jgi:hypothetical protein